MDDRQHLFHNDDDDDDDGDDVGSGAGGQDSNSEILLNRRLEIECFEM